MLELCGLGQGRTGHAGERLVHTEVVLDRDRGEGDVLFLDANVLLRLDRLVHPLRVAAPFQHAAGELVDDLHLAVRDEVIDIALVQLLCTQRVLHVVDQRRGDLVVEVLDAEHLLDLVHAFFGHGNRALLLIYLVVQVGAKAGDQARERPVPLRRLLGRTRDDQRGARLVDEDRVDLVDDPEVVTALHALIGRPRHVVAQVVEPEFVVRPVRDVGRVRRAALFGAHVRLDQPDRETEEPVDATHPLGVAFREVVVHGDDVDAVARQRVHVRRQRRDEGLAFAGLHLGDVAAVQDGAADQLDVVVALPERPDGGFTDGCERFGKDLVEVLPFHQARAEDIGERAQLCVGPGLHLGLESADAVGEASGVLEATTLADAKDLLQGRRRQAVSPTGSRAASRGRRRRPPACASAGAAFPRCCGCGSSRCSLR